MSRYIAHIDNNGNVQTVQEHSIGTAVLSREYALPEYEDICYVLGLLHDIGKYQDSFQKRIRGSSITVEHAICGARTAWDTFDKEHRTPIGLLLALCIAGHHSGIPDCGIPADAKEMPTLFGRMNRDTEPYSAYKDELEIPDIDIISPWRTCKSSMQTKEELLEGFAFLARYCFSCLTDADTVDTMRATGKTVPAPMVADFKACYRRVCEKLCSFHPVTPLQKARAALQEQSFANIRNDSDIYLMEMPTGSGKTLASLRCALYRAVETGKKRIIYVIPYNSIIDQTVEVFEDVLGSSARILRHQSSYSYETQEGMDEECRKSAVFACENWNAQIIVTTAVQFFESVYANKRGRLRKMHNMAESVIIFDEAHLMPTEYLQPCLRAIAYTTKILHSEAIFLTATMPDFRALLSRYALKTSKITELVRDHSLFPLFKRKEYVYIGTVPDTVLAEKSAEYASCLIVVNSRKAAKELYRMCRGRKYHLSTYMTVYDRKRVMDAVKRDIDGIKKDYGYAGSVPPDRRVTVISTSLIEAGVDLDFHTVFRELNGLDHLIQAGGRGDREGTLGMCRIHVFEREGHTRETIESNITRRLLSDGKDVTSDRSIREYYDILFRAKADEIEKNSLCRQMEASGKKLVYNRIPFRSYSENMKLIDNDAISVVIARDAESRDACEAGKALGWLDMRKMQAYCCCVYPHELEELLRQHAVENIGGIFVLSRQEYYDAETGIRLWL